MPRRVEIGATGGNEFGGGDSGNEFGGGDSGNEFGGGEFGGNDGRVSLPSAGDGAGAESLDKGTGLDGGRGIGIDKGPEIDKGMDIGKGVDANQAMSNAESMGKDLEPGGAKAHPPPPTSGEAIGKWQMKVAKEDAAEEKQKSEQANKKGQAEADDDKRKLEQLRAFTDFK